MIKFHKVVIKITVLRDRTSDKMVYLNKQRAIAPECMVRYGSL